MQRSGVIMPSTSWAMCLFMSSDITISWSVFFGTGAGGKSSLSVSALLIIFAWFWCNKAGDQLALTPAISFLGIQGFLMLAVQFVAELLRFLQGFFLAVRGFGASI